MSFATEKLSGMMMVTYYPIDDHGRRLRYVLRSLEKVGFDIMEPCEYDDLLVILEGYRIIRRCKLRSDIDFEIECRGIRSNYIEKLLYILSYETSPGIMESARYVFEQIKRISSEQLH